MTDSDLPNQTDVQNVAQYLRQKSLHLWDATWTRDYCACAIVITAGSTGSTAPTEYIFYRSIFREPKLNSKAMPDGCRDAMLSLLAWFIPHAQCNVNESVYSDCTKLRFGKSWVNRSELLWYSLPERRDHLEIPRVASLFPQCLCPKSLHKLRSSRWCRLCTKIIPQPYSRRSRRRGLAGKM